MTLLDELSNAAITESIKIHRAIGPGVLESVYEVLLAHALLGLGFEVKQQLAVPIKFNGIHFEEGFRIDLLIQDTLLIEIKSTPKLVPVHGKQLLTYLRLMNLPLGLLINFGGETLKEGVKRVVNNLAPNDSPLLRVNRVHM